MEALISEHIEVIIQIATPFSTGTGFYLKQYNLIVTNEHLIRDTHEVVIEGLGFEKQMSKVLYWNAQLDLAFLAGPVNSNLPEVILCNLPLSPDDEVIALGHPFGKAFESEKGVITAVDFELEGVLFWKHNAILPKENSGGPLFNKDKKIVALNTFIVRNEETIGFALPTATLQQSLETFQKAGDLESVNCFSCSYHVTSENIEKSKCPSCSAKVVLPSALKSFEALGVAKTIETIIEKAGYDVQLSRRGWNNWTIQKGSANINIAYYEKKGLITGDAYLCKLPAKKDVASNEVLKEVYKYLLKQNYQIERLNLSVKNDFVVLSLLIYDRYLDARTGTKLFQQLFEKADYYDNVLVEQYGAKWRN